MVPVSRAMQPPLKYIDRVFLPVAIATFQCCFNKNRDRIHWILDTGYWVLDTGYRKLDTRCWILDTEGRWGYCAIEISGAIYTMPQNLDRAGTLEER